MRVIAMSCAILLVACFLPAAFPAGAAAAERPGGKKVLIAYFSLTGNTEQVAKYIHEAVGGDLFRIEAADPYPEEYRPATERAKAEQERDARPALANRVDDMGAYDTVFIGYPLWWGTIPMPLFTFLEQYDFSGKTVVPFCTHGGSGLAGSVGDIDKLCPGATVREALAIRGADVGGAQGAVAAWLKGVGTKD